jgi:hypothetical protein
MNKHQHDRFPRLAIVGPTDRKPRQQPAGLPWWGPQRSRNLGLKQVTQTAQVPCQEIRMAVMPTLSRNLLFAAIAWIWNFLRGSFRTQRRRGADILLFRRPAGSGFRRVMLQESFSQQKT